MSLILDGSVGVSDVDGSAATPAIRGTDANTGMFFPAADTIAFSEGGVESMRINSLGNLGIGETNPSQAKLQVAQSSTAAGAIYAVSASNQNGNAFLFGISGISNGYQITNNGSNNIEHIWSGTGNAARMIINSAGDVGIGTTSPTSLLHLYNSSLPRIRFENTSRNYSIGGNGSAFTFSDVTGGVEVMRIDSSQQLLIGTTSGGAKLTVVGNGEFSNYTSSGYQLASYSPSGADRNVFIAGVLGISNGFTVRYLSGAMQYVMSGLATGTVSSTGGILSASSDMNMKVADGEVESALEKVNSLKPRYFYWKDKNGNADAEQGRQLGFYAQEVNAVIPEASPEPAKEHESWGIYDRALVATLTAAIQEQQAMIEELKAKVAALEAA